MRHGTMATAAAWSYIYASSCSPLLLFVAHSRDYLLQYLGAGYGAWEALSV